MIVILIESFKGLRNLTSIISQNNVTAAGLGLEDLFSEMIQEKEDTPELTKFIKLEFISKVKSFGIPTIDSISLEFHEFPILQQHVQKTKEMGFDAMFSIHPKQIGVIQERLTLSRDKIEWAEKVVQLVDAHKSTDMLK